MMHYPISYCSTLMSKDGAILSQIFVLMVFLYRFVIDLVYTMKFLKYYQDVDYASVTGFDFYAIPLSVMKR